MKTAEEILKNHISIDTNSGYKIGLNDTIINAMKEYAIEVAKEALRNASRNCTDHFYNQGYSFDFLDQQSITTESNIPTLI